MKNLLIVITSLVLTGNIGFGQSKKELRLTVARHQSDSTAFEKKIRESTKIISNLNTEISEVKELNKQLNNQISELSTVKDANTRLTDSIVQLNARLDSINSYYRITQFVEAFYHSLEFSDEENLRQYEYGDVKFDLENFYALISINSRYSKGRVKNLTSDKTHQNFYIMLQSIEEIKFSLNKIIVRTKVMYSGENMGLFYNEEQLTLRDKKGVLKLTDWVDLDLYKMVHTIEASVENFTREDFYRWLDGKN